MPDLPPSGSGVDRLTPTTSANCSSWRSVNYQNTVRRRELLGAMIEQKEKFYGNVYKLDKIVCVMLDGSNRSETELVRKPRHFTRAELVCLDGDVGRFFQSLPISRVRAREKVMQPFLGKQRFAGIRLGERNSVIIPSKSRSRPGPKQA